MGDLGENWNSYQPKNLLKKPLGNKLLRFVPKTPEKAMELRKGGIAIIDQIICSHAKWFIGTEDSTFSFRINEERSILGFSKKSTYNRFCKDGKKECGTPTFWEIIYDAKDEMY